MRIAEVSHAWAMLEAVLANFIEHMISEPYLSDQTRTTGRLGMKLFEAFHTFNQHWSLMVAALESRLAQDELAAINRTMKTLKTRLTKASKLRNEIVHSLYGIEIEYEMRDGSLTYSDDGDYLLRSKPYALIDDAVGGYERIDHKRITAVIETIRDARHKLEEFTERVKSRKRIPIKGTKDWIEEERAKARDNREEALPSE